jgi:hypothetical protein
MKMAVICSFKTWIDFNALKTTAVRASGAATLFKMPNMVVTRSDGRQCPCRAQSETLQLSTEFTELLAYFLKLHFLVCADLAVGLVLIAWFPNLP